MLHNRPLWISLCTERTLIRVRGGQRGGRKMIVDADGFGGDGCVC